jgi:hypothetical protein
VITTRLPVADLADHERTSVLRRELEQLSSDGGAKLLRALGVKGDEADLRTASDEFSGHCLALTLLGSYLTDAFDGDIRRRDEVSTRLAHDVRQGVHARKVMESYQTWFGEGPELSVLRMLGLFDRPADEKAFGVKLFILMQAGQYFELRCGESFPMSAPKPQRSTATSARCSFPLAKNQIQQHE